MALIDMHVLVKDLRVGDRLRLEGDPDVWYTVEHLAKGRSDRICGQLRYLTLNHPGGAFERGCAADTDEIPIRREVAETDCAAASS